MYSRMALGVILVYVLAGGRTVSATDLKIIPNVSSGVTYFEYKQEANFFPDGQAFAASDYKISGFLPLLGGQLRVEYFPFYVGVQGQKTFKGEDRDEITLTTLGAAQTLKLDSEFDRFELNATAGYYITENLSAFAGYKYAEVNVSNLIIGQSNVPPLPPIPPIEGQIDLDFSYHGPFAGIFYTLPIERLHGNFHFSSALSYYFGDAKQEFKPSGLTSTPAISTDSGGNTVGYFFETGWLGRLSDTFYYSLRADISESTFEAEGRFADFSETEYRFRVGLEYVFNTGTPFNLNQ